jgi:hypothetical protein
MNTMNTFRNDISLKLEPPGSCQYEPRGENCKKLDPALQAYR